MACWERQKRSFLKFVATIYCNKLIINEFGRISVHWAKFHFLSTFAAALFFSDSDLKQQG